MRTDRIPFALTAALVVVACPTPAIACDDAGGAGAAPLHAKPTKPAARPAAPAPKPGAGTNATPAATPECCLPGQGAAAPKIAACCAKTAAGNPQPCCIGHIKGKKSACCEAAGMRLMADPAKDPRTLAPCCAKTTAGDPQPCCIGHVEGKKSACCEAAGMAIRPTAGGPMAAKPMAGHQMGAMPACCQKTAAGDPQACCLAHAKGDKQACCEASAAKGDAKEACCEAMAAGKPEECCSAQKPHAMRMDGKPGMRVERRIEMRGHKGGWARHFPNATRHKTLELRYMPAGATSANQFVIYGRDKHLQLNNWVSMGGQMNWALQTNPAAGNGNWLVPYTGVMPKLGTNLGPLRADVGALVGLGAMLRTGGATGDALHARVMWLVEPRVELGWKGEDMGVGVVGAYNYNPNMAEFGGLSAGLRLTWKRPGWM